MFHRIERRDQRGNGGLDQGELVAFHELVLAQEQQELQRVGVAPTAHIVALVVLGLHQRVIEFGHDEVQGAQQCRVRFFGQFLGAIVAVRADQGRRADGGASDAIAQRDLGLTAITLVRRNAVHTFVGPLGLGFTLCQGLLTGENQLHATRRSGFQVGLGRNFGSRLGLISLVLQALLLGCFGFLRRLALRRLGGRLGLGLGILGSDEQHTHESEERGGHRPSH